MIIIVIIISSLRAFRRARDGAAKGRGSWERIRWPDAKYEVAGGDKPVTIEARSGRTGGFLFCFCIRCLLLRRQPRSAALTTCAVITKPQQQQTDRSLTRTFARQSRGQSI